MKKIILLLVLISLATFAASEQDHTTPWCIEMGGLYKRTDVRLPNGRYPDCITNKYIIEVDKAGNFYEGIGQVLHYYDQDGGEHIPMLALIVDRNNKADMRNYRFAVETASANCPKIKVVIIDKIL